MSTVQEVFAAMEAADAAGDTAKVKQLGAFIQELQGTAPPPPPPPKPGLLNEGKRGATARSDDLADVRQTLQTTSSIEQTPLHTKNIDRGEAYSHAAIQTVAVMAIAVAVHWLLARRLWKKPRTTPHELGYWWGTWVGCLQLGLTVGKFTGSVLYGTVSDNDYYLLAMNGVMVAGVFGLFAYVAGWLFRRLLKPAKPPAISPASSPLPTSEESVRPPVNGETTGTSANSSLVTPMARGTPSAAHTNSAAPLLKVTPQGRSHSPTATPFSAVTVEGQPSTPDLADEALYEKALNELSTGKKPGLWAKALAQTANGGNPDGAYIALRVEQMRQEHAQLRPDQNENPTATWVQQSQPSSSASETAKFANESRVLQLRMHFDTSVESVQRGKDTAGMFDKHYQTLHRFRSAIDARKLVWLCDYELLGPGEDSRFETTYTLRRSAAYDPIAEFKDEREFVNWALLNFAIRHSNDVGYI